VAQKYNYTEGFADDDGESDDDYEDDDDDYEDIPPDSAASAAASSSQSPALSPSARRYQEYYNQAKNMPPEMKTQMVASSMMSMARGALARRLMPRPKSPPPPGFAPKPPMHSPRARTTVTTSAYEPTQAVPLRPPVIEGFPPENMFRVALKYWRQRHVPLPRLDKLGRFYKRHATSINKALYPGAPRSVDADGLPKDPKMRLRVEWEYYSMTQPHATAEELMALWAATSDAEKAAPIPQLSSLLKVGPATAPAAASASKGELSNMSRRRGGYVRVATPPSSGSSREVTPDVDRALSPDDEDDELRKQAKWDADMGAIPTGGSRENQMMYSNFLARDNALQQVKKKTRLHQEQYATLSAKQTAEEKRKTQLQAAIHHMVKQYDQVSASIATTKEERRAAKKLLSASVAQYSEQKRQDEDLHERIAEEYWGREEQREGGGRKRDGGWEKWCGSR
jgi:hypothetical protein